VANASGLGKSTLVSVKKTVETGAKRKAGDDISSPASGGDNTKKANRRSKKVKK
jgi:hypothetical protein